MLSRSKFRVTVQPYVCANDSTIKLTFRFFLRDVPAICINAASLRIEARITRKK